MTDIQHITPDFETPFEKLMRSCSYIGEDSSRELIRAAFQEAVKAFETTNPEIVFRSVATARIAAEEMGMDTTGLMAALLQEVNLPEGKDADAFKNKFGENVFNIISKIQKIRKLRMDKIAMMPENFIQLLLSMSNDIRVILVRLANRISLMRNIESFSPAEQKQFSTEISSLYAPLAHRLGLYKIKAEFEDLAMRHSMPEIYRSIAIRIKETAAEHKKYFQKFITPISKSLIDAGLDFEVKSRAKAIPSIYAKMKAQGVEFDEIFDFYAIRIILNSLPENEKADCWKAYSHVTDIYPPNTTRLRDWISNPRPNGYESLHVTVESPGNQWVEVQIRTRRMDDNAENGQAAHWRYKERKGGSQSASETWLQHIRSMLENYVQGDEELSTAVSEQPISENIFVFTPEGHLKKLRAGATVLDFAFDVHTDVGLHCNGAKVNSLFVPLKYVLKTGDHIEIITSKNQKPNIDWLNWAVSPRALSKIKRALKDAEFSRAEQGRDTLMRKLAQLKVDYNDDIGNRLVVYYKASSALDLFHGIAEEKYDIQKLKEALLPPPKPEEQHPVIKSPAKPSPDLRRKGKQKPLVFINDDTPLTDVKFARCCQPVPGDDIFGFITVAEGVKIHRKDCPNALLLREKFSYRMVKARWAEVTEISSYIATLRISGTDQSGILNEITAILSGELNANVRSINFNSRNGKFDGAVVINVQGIAHLNLIIGRLQKIKAVKKVVRES